MEQKDYQKALDDLTNVPTGNGFVGDFSKYRWALLALQYLVGKENAMPIKKDLVCPNETCRKDLEVFTDSGYYKLPRCPYCGQRLDWSEDNEKHK